MLGLYKYGLCWLILTWILLLFISQIIDTLGRFIDPSFARFRYLFLFLIVLSVIIYLIIRKINWKKIQALNPVFNVFIFVLTGLTIVSGLRVLQKENRHMTILNGRKFPSFNIKSDLIWILLDEYTDPVSLKSQFKADNYLVDSLKLKGFFVFDTLHSRSDTTVYSVGSLFNLDDNIPIANYNYATNYLNQSILVKNLQRGGYDFVNLDFFNIGGHPKLSYLRIFPDKFVDQIISGSVFAVLMEKFNEEAMPFDSYNQKVINAFKSNVLIKRTKPIFIWAHLLIPHAPFYRDANGNLNKFPVLDIKAAPPSTATRQYINYLNYANKVVLKMLNEIPDWKNKTIIISGDHGARMLVPANDPRRKQTFGAIYYPGMDKKELSKIKYMQQIPFHLH